MKSSFAHVTRGGQVSIPAPIRHRWDTDTLLLEDRGDEVVLRPIPRDPVGAAVGALRLPRGLTTDAMRERSRREDADSVRGAR